MIGIIGAMDAEVQLLTEQMQDVKEEKIGFARFYTGRLFGKECAVGRCGVGKVHAAMCAQSMILKYEPEVIVNIGVAGALRDELKIGDIVVANAAVQHDMDTTPVGDPMGLISGINMVYIPTDESVTEKLIWAAEKLGYAPLRANAATGDQFVASLEKKYALAEQFGAACCDMEGGAIAQACYEMQVPFGEYRGISDETHDTGREYLLNMQEAARNSARLICEFVKDWEM
ncbi:MAG: 5'-methylthioadenosine/adenosylhomocysteine nucleosidase [Clostridia bacterium]|nr:5'-methylthioadenosine/adenosylhomocysteine nucleosidase [Clostridia bacterium]